jgi:hypothetical protein
MDKALQILEHAKLTGSIKLEDVKHLLIVVADKVLNNIADPKGGKSK